jgi:hypothetical protein
VELFLIAEVVAGPSEPRAHSPPFTVIGGMVPLMLSLWTAVGIPAYSMFAGLAAGSPAPGRQGA